ncbi:MAG: hypothetical protein NXI22_09040 [bacterium]|nr:hypothetical protein [bacterium]
MSVKVRQEIEKWASKHPPIVSLAALQIAFGARDVIGLYSMFQRNGLGAMRFGGVDREEWLSMYTKPRRWRDAVVELVCPSRSVEVLEMLQAVRSFSRQPQNEIVKLLAEIPEGELRKKSQIVFRYTRMKYAAQLRELLEPAAEMDEESSEWHRERFSTVELQFFFRVVFPCFVQYGKFPSQLLYEACRRENPDCRSLSFLVGVDPIVQHHSWLFDVLHPKSHALQLKRCRVVGKALSKRATKLSSQRIKYRFASLISIVSDWFGDTLKEPEIRQIFDLVANLGDKQRDTDLAAAPETFQKAINRNRKFWSFLPKPDKTFQKAVRAHRKKVA